MVLLPLTCDHHLSVSCSALETPASLGAISSIYHQVVLLNCSTPSFPYPSSPPAHLVTFFLNCLPSVTLSVTSPVILPCAYKLWLFCAEMRQTGGSLLPRSPSLKTTPRRKKKKKRSKHIVVESHFLFGCFLAYFPPCTAPPDELHPFVHPPV